MKDIPQIVCIKLSTLVIDNSLSGRTDSEIKANAKALAPMMSAFGGWDPRQPGQYFVRDGKKHLAGGFTRTAAALSLDFKEGYFVEKEDDRATLRIACITSNAGKPISLFEQGRIYTAMRDGDDATTLKQGEVGLSAMAIKDIAAEVGYTRQHVENCIAIFNSSPEIAELIQEGKVSANIVVRAQQLVKEDGKRLRFLKAAIATAKNEGKEIATMKHLDAVRPDFAPLKAAKATPTDPVDPEPKKTTVATTEVTKTEKPESKKPETPALKGMDDLGKSSGKNNSSPMDGHPQEDIDEMESLLHEWREERKVNASDDDISDLAIRLLDK